MPSLWEAASTVLFFGGVSWGAIKFATRMTRDVVSPPDEDEGARLAGYVATHTVSAPGGGHIAPEQVGTYTPRPASPLDKFAGSWPLYCPRCHNAFAKFEDLLIAEGQCPSCGVTLLLHTQGSQLRLTTQ